MAAEPYRFIRRGRSRATLLAVALTWGACLAAFLVFEAASWVVGLILLFTLPALADILSGTTAGTDVTAETLAWHSGGRRGEVALHEIDHVRLVTRLDLSVRAVLVLRTGRKLRLPVEATPPHRDFEAALAAHGLRTERHHFTQL